MLRSGLRLGLGLGASYREGGGGGVVRVDDEGRVGGAGRIAAILWTDRQTKRGAQRLGQGGQRLASGSIVMPA